MTTYTAITFAPVQGFIEKSRKLIDLYGSSYLLSYLAYDLCKLAESKGHEVVSPGIKNHARGTPNNILICGELSRKDAEDRFNEAWKIVTSECRYWIEERLKSEFEFCWDREWKQWGNHAWEFFWGSGNDIESARQELFARKLSRNWEGVNWQGDSSDLSGADAIAWQNMTPRQKFKKRNFGAESDEIDRFYQQLSQQVGLAFIEGVRKKDEPDRNNFKNVTGKREAELSKIFGEAIISPREKLSIPELVKRLVVLDTVSEVINEKLEQKLKLEDSNYESFKSSYSLKPSDISEEIIEEKVAQNIPIEAIEIPFTEYQRHDLTEYTGWFLGDGDRVSTYLRDKEPHEVKEFSQAFLNWGRETLKNSVELNQETEQEEKSKYGRLIYAGGDDFLGTFNPKTKAKDCWQWLESFPNVWQQHGYRNEGVTVSVGFVWTGHRVPQREVLQHCREAEQTAKNRGRDRLAIRIVFNNGNYLEWMIPWRFINMLSAYRDREGKKNWTHIFNDVAILEARHAFNKENIEVAQGILRIYFPECSDLVSNDSDLWNQDGIAGILGEREDYAKSKQGLTPQEQINLAINDWVINLAKIGFHLFGNDSD